MTLTPEQIVARDAAIAARAAREARRAAEPKLTESEKRAIEEGESRAKAREVLAKYPEFRQLLIDAWNDGDWMGHDPEMGGGMSNPYEEG